MGCWGLRSFSNSNEGCVIQMKHDEQILFDLQELYVKYGYVFRDEINIFGFRDELNQDEDKWNDYIGVCFPQEKKTYLFTATTDPGRYYTENPYSGTSGAAHLCLGQYLETYQVGNHMGRQALCQWNKPVKIWRDKNKNYKFDKGIDELNETSWAGINIHYPGKNAEDEIEYSSAGCQVIKPDKDDYYKQWEYFFKLVTDAMDHYNIKYVDYTVFNMHEIPMSIGKVIEEILDKG